MTSPETSPVPGEAMFDQNAYEKANTLEEETNLGKANKILFPVGIGATITIIVFAIIVGIFWTKTPRIGETKTFSPQTSMPTSAVTPTPPPMDRMFITFEVLNGSGISGAAGRAAQKLRDKGYTVISIGNADDTVETSIVTFSKGVGFESEILSDLDRLFSVGSSSGALVNSTASARLIVGKK